MRFSGPFTVLFSWELPTLTRVFPVELKKGMISCTESNIFHTVGHNVVISKLTVLKYHIIIYSLLLIVSRRADIHASSLLFKCHRAATPVSIS